MTTKFLPIRRDIRKEFKKFSWASINQERAIWDYSDHLLAGRESGRQALLRTGMSNLTARLPAEKQPLLPPTIQRTSTTTKHYY